MKKKRKQEEKGAPGWMVTYGDMMSLLLCFFIMLAAFSELKSEEEFERVVDAFREAFGYVGGEGRAPMTDLPLRSMIERLEEIALYREKFARTSQAEDPGMLGRQTSVQRVREGLQFTVGGLITFEPASAELKPEAEAQLARIAGIIRGQNNKIEVRGHATAMELLPGSAFQDALDLSYARAEAVRDVLTSSANGIRPKRIRVVACGDTEPLVQRRYDFNAVAVNRRVELIVNEALIQDFEAPQEEPAVSLVAD